MRGRLRGANPKELSHVAKVLGLSVVDLFVLSLSLLFSPLIKIEAIWKLIFPLSLIALNKYLNRKHPGIVYISYIRRKKVFKWAGSIKRINE